MIQHPIDPVSVLLLYVCIQAEMQQKFNSQNSSNMANATPHEMDSSGGTDGKTRWVRNRPKKLQKKLY